MPRKKPTSQKKKKEEQKLKRAVKRGQVDPPPPKARKPKNLRPAHNAPPTSVSQKLQSSFAKLSRQFLENTKELASTVPLPRPIPPEVAILAESYADDAQAGSLTCPRRPKWKYDMSKKEVESNEEGLHKKWLKQTDEVLEKWRMAGSPTKISEDDQRPTERAPSSFERNLEVWRQFWRVTEISQIILVLVDSRCPLLHYPPSLASFLSNHKVILVLTKVDISGPTRAASWTDYFRAQFPGLRVVQVQSYASKEEGSYHQGRTQYESQIPQTFKDQLVNAIRELHAEILEPPEKVKANPKSLSNWRPSVKRTIDWSLNTQTQHEPSVDVPDSADPGQEEKEPPFLTIGLVGQPNVGKSSLLNALFGQSKVRASKTPGKTKHYQTLFLTRDIRLVDCPGLVMPNYVPMELQVLSGVLPISRVSAIPACIHFASQLLPLEDIFKLTHPKANETPIPDNRTWREGMKRVERAPLFWTAMDVLVAFANKKGWVTAKAGRPDFSRAGNAILRALAEGQVSWGFWPPGTPPAKIESEMGESSNHGLWIQRVDQDEAQGYVSSSDGEEEEDDDEESEGAEEEEEEEEEGIVVDENEAESDHSQNSIDDEDNTEYTSLPSTASRFAALQVFDEDSETNHSSDDE